MAIVDKKARLVRWLVHERQLDHTDCMNEANTFHAIRHKESISCMSKTVACMPFPERHVSFVNGNFPSRMGNFPREWELSLKTDDVTPPPFSNQYMSVLH